MLHTVLASAGLIGTRYFKRVRYVAQEQRGHGRNGVLLSNRLFTLRRTTVEREIIV